MANVKYQNVQSESGENVKVEIISSRTYNQTQIVNGAMAKHKAYLREEDFDAADAELDDAERAIAICRVEVAKKREAARARAAQE